MKSTILFWFFISAFGLFSNAQGTLDSGLVAFFPFNGNALDESANTNDGIVTGATLVQDRFGTANSAYSFNGVTDVITIPYSTTLEFTNEVTFAAWINVESKSLPYLGRIVIKNSGPDNDPFGMYHGYTNYIYTQVEDYSNSVTEGGLTPENSINELQWEFVAITWDGDSLKVYINCDLISAFATDAVENMTSAISDITIGNKATPDIVTGILGEIDDVRIYNRALTLEEVDSLASCETISYIAEFNNPHTTLFPNPANDRVSFSEIPMGSIISIYNSLGQELKSLIFYGQTIDVSYLKSGVYLIQARQKGQVLMSKKLIKNDKSH